MNIFIALGLALTGFGCYQEFFMKKSSSTVVKKTEEKTVIDNSKEINEIESNIQKLKLESGDPEKIKVLEAKLAELKG